MPWPPISSAPYLRSEGWISTSAFSARSIGYRSSELGVARVRARRRSRRPRHRGRADVVLAPGRWRPGDRRFVDGSARRGGRGCRGRPRAGRGSAGASPAGPGRPSSARRAARAGARPRRPTPAMRNDGIERAERAREAAAVEALADDHPAAVKAVLAAARLDRGGDRLARLAGVGGDDGLEPEQAAVLGALGGAHLGPVERRRSARPRAAPSVPGARACSRGGGTGAGRAPRSTTGSGSAGSGRPTVRPTATWARAICSSGEDACSSPSAISE